MSGSTTAPPVEVVRSLPGPAGYMCGLTWDGTWLWHSDQDAARIFAIDPADGAVRRSFAYPDVRADLGYADGRLCQIGGRPKRILLIDPASGETVGVKPVRPSNGRVTGMEVGPQGVWLCLRAPAVVQLRDFETMTVQREHPVHGSPSGLTYAEGHVLYAEFEEGLLHAVDAESGQVRATVRVPGHPTGLAWDGEVVWYCDFADRRFKAVRLPDVLDG
ncbi:hypothetical protein ACQPYA_19430 [Micromonospora sp. CA-263727]|uniref:hypothetical protein n=1 Tax=Micromonospora sp. CA-263727 TaxID=3239967 RepID=UPI003D91A304